MFIVNIVVFSLCVSLPRIELGFILRVSIAMVLWTCFLELRVMVLLHFNWSGHRTGMGLVHLVVVLL